MSRSGRRRVTDIASSGNTSHRPSQKRKENRRVGSRSVVCKPSRSRKSRSKPAYVLLRASRLHRAVQPMAGTQHHSSFHGESACCLELALAGCACRHAAHLCCTLSGSGLVTGRSLGVTRCRLRS
eukprot:759757-Hanusia_phi.AAC.3